MTHNSICHFVAVAIMVKQNDSNAQRNIMRAQYEILLLNVMQISRADIRSDLDMASVDGINPSNKQ